MIVVDFYNGLAQIGPETDGWKSENKELEQLLNDNLPDPAPQMNTQDPDGDLAAYAIDLFGGQIVREAKKPRLAPDPDSPALNYGRK